LLTPTGYLCALEYRRVKRTITCLCRSADRIEAQTMVLADRGYSAAD
jgi:hypothetical protein